MGILVLLSSVLVDGSDGAFVIEALQDDDPPPIQADPPPDSRITVWRLDVSVGGGADTRVAHFDDDLPTPSGSGDQRGFFADARAGYDLRTSVPLEGGNGDPARAGNQGTLAHDYLHFGLGLATDHRVQADRDLRDFDVHDSGARGFLGGSSRVGSGYFRGEQSLGVLHQISGNEAFALDFLGTTSLSYGWEGFGPPKDDAEPATYRYLDDPWDPAYYRVTLYQTLVWRNDTFDQDDVAEPDRDGRDYLLGLGFAGSFPSKEAPFVTRGEEKQRVPPLDRLVHRHDLLGLRAGFEYQQRSTDDAIYDLDDGYTVLAGVHVPLGLLRSGLYSTHLALDVEGSFHWADYDRAGRTERARQGFFGLSWRAPGKAVDHFVRAGASLFSQDSNAANFDFDRNVYTLEYTVRFGTRRQGVGIRTPGSDVSPGPIGTPFLDR